MDIRQSSERVADVPAKVAPTRSALEVHSTFERFIDLASKLAALGAKVGVFIGGLCFGIYCVRIGYFPSDVSIGDGFLFLVMACSFGMLYLVLVASLVGLGIVASPGLRPIFKWIGHAISKWKSRQGLGSHTFNRTAAVNEWAGFDSSAIPFAIVGVLFIWGFARINVAALWTLPLSAVSLYVLYSVYWNNDRKLTAIVKRRTSPIVQAHESALVEDIERLRRIRNQAIFFMLATPMLVTGVMSSVLDGAMRAVNLRQDHAIVYLAPPYSNLLPTYPMSNAMKGYAEIKDATVLLHGIGKNTVLSAKLDRETRELVVPDDKLIISRK
ncbi:hypothetical protein SAMN04487926_101485 [Paraburkholderia steynii]|uniref:Uncharacterized protein n=1 Tax=Paraburkholderia steynii TaxID=1245441 RepID=A0A7Z7B4U2_9BURK|nr:hypothetical protein [Paraburkholderia steynii]SDG97715.1 hypothetical protein SAMN04487926_101485 [Paraburkholderia steynii]